MLFPFFCTFRTTKTHLKPSVRLCQKLNSVPKFCSTNIDFESSFRFIDEQGSETDFCNPKWRRTPPRPQTSQNRSEKIASIPKYLGMKNAVGLRGRGMKAVGALPGVPREALLYDNLVWISHTFNFPNAPMTSQLLPTPERQHPRLPEKNYVPENFIPPFPQYTVLGRHAA